MRCSTAPTDELSSARTSTTFTRFFWSDSFWSCASGRYTSTPWPPSGGLTSPTIVNFVPLRFSFEPTFSDFRAA